MAVMMYVTELVLVSSARLMSAITDLMRGLRLSGWVMNVCSCDASYEVHYSLLDLIAQRLERFHLHRGVRKTAGVR